MNPRETLMWVATKARKKNLIDGKTLEVVRRLAKEPSTPANDLKLQAFLSSFLCQLAKKDASFAAVSGAGELKEDSAKQSALELLPQDLVSAQICKFLTNEDLICVAQTSFGVNTLFLPPNAWVRLITSKLDSNKYATVLQELFPFHNNEQHAYTRYESMQNFSKGVRFLQIDSEDRIAFEIMQRYMLPRISALHFKLTCSLQNKSAGDTMFLERAECEFPHIKLAFRVTGSPPVVNAGNPQSEFALHALARDGHSISPIAKFTCGQRNASSSTVQLLSTQEGCGGKSGITLCGERSARWLGRLMYNDEYHFQVELTTTANGQHGMGNHLSSGFRESIVLQTPRTVFKVPDRYYEVAPALGIIIMVPLQVVFEHCVNL